MNQNQSLVDLTSLRELLGDNDAGIHEILGLFVSNIPDSLKEVRSLYDSQDWEALRKKVHSIKSYYGYVGQVELNEKLSAWEGDLAIGKGRDSAPLVMELETKSHIILQELAEILSGKI
jgi:hypothetical protein